MQQSRDKTMMKKAIIVITTAVIVALVFYAAAATENSISREPPSEKPIFGFTDGQNSENLQSGLIDLESRQLVAEMAREEKEIQTLRSTYPKLEIELARVVGGTEPTKKINVIILLKSEPSVSSLKSQESVVNVLRDGNAETKYQYHLINGITASMPAGLIEKVANRQDVECVCLDREIRLPAPPEGCRTPYIATHAESAGSVVSTEDQVWDEGIDGTGVVVAVIDTGIDKNHPDLYGKVVAEKNFVENEPTTNDLYGHGTHCAGIIAGTGEASAGRYKGVAPGASLMNVRVLDSEGFGSLSDVIAGIEWAVDNGADVISISLGGAHANAYIKPDCMAVDAAMDAGVVVCVAAGNSG